MPIIQTKYYTTSDGSDRPKKNHFKFSKNPYTLKETDFIKLNCVYQESKNENGTPSFFRFFSNGKYFSSAVLKDTTPIYWYNDLNRGNVGYYRIDGNKVLLEYFSVGAQDCGKYNEFTMEIINGNLDNLKKIDIGGLKGTPDW